MRRARSESGELLNTPMGWHMVRGAQQISNNEFLHMVEKGGFEQLPDLITWKQYQTVLCLFFPWKAKVDLCARCEGTMREASGNNCARCKGQGVERIASVA